MCYYKLDYYDVSLEILSVYLNLNPMSPTAMNLKEPHPHTHAHTTHAHAPTPTPHACARAHTHTDARVVVTS